MTLLLPALLMLAVCAQDGPEATPMTATAEPPLHERLHLSDDEWRHRLTPEQFAVLRQQGTERPFCGGYVATKDHGPGTYRCAGCGNPLFDGGQKFDSGTGWPSFWDCFRGRVAMRSDRSHGMVRTEVVCARCDGHLGHLFDDGPPPTEARFCINAVSLRFDPYRPPVHPPTARSAVFAAGCFWGVEARFRSLPGVVDARVGYIGGTVAHPTYEQVCAHGTGHAEAVEVVYDPALTSYDALLDAFFAGHDPTTPDRQGPDVGDQYRSALWPADPAQRAAAVAAIARWQPRFSAPIVTRLESPATFWPAEEYHQRYQAKRGLTVSCH